MIGVSLEPALDAKLARLHAWLAALPSALVAFSGGVDSSLLLRVAHDALGPRVTALTSVSPTNPEEDTAAAVALARALGVAHVIIPSNELEIPRYAANPTNRCYLCKDRLYEEHRVRHPLVEAELHKAELRAISRALGLATWDKPASPCLSSRFPYGTEITLDRLRMVAAAEASLRALGFRDVRVRFHGDVGRVEIGADELARLDDARLREAAIRGVRDAGFRDVTIDPRGFRSGSLNEGVVGREIA